jgi:hypothetical protein
MFTAPLRSGPHKTPFPTVTQLFRAYSLPRERVYVAIVQKRSLLTGAPLSNGSVHHSAIVFDCMVNLWNCSVTWVK